MLRPTDIVSTNDIRKILKFISFRSCIIFDLDNTVIEPHDIENGLGSDQWFVAMLDYAQGLSLERKEAFDLVITLYHAVHRYIYVQTVQQEVIFLIKVLRDIGLPVIALTSRGDGMKRQTERQLEYLKIQFDEIIYCNGLPKNECLQKYFDKTEKPRHVVMADDKLRHLQEIQKLMQELSIKFDGLRYGFLDEKVQQFSFCEATKCLHALIIKLSAHEVDAMAKLNLLPAFSIFKPDFELPIASKPAIQNNSCKYG